MPGTIECADAVALLDGKLVLVERLNHPQGLALPGGKLEPCEIAKVAVFREFEEETGMTFTLEGYVGRFDTLGRDPRGDYASEVFYGKATGEPRGEPGKTQIVLLDLSELEMNRSRFVFDHYDVVQAYLAQTKSV